MRLRQVIGASRREAFKKQWLDRAVPGGIDNGLVREHRVRIGGRNREQNQQPESGARCFKWSRHFFRNTFLLMSGQNSAPRLAKKSNPSSAEPWMNPRRDVLSRSGYHWLERNAAP